ncbi:uncharacterized protein LOC132201697 [Neocloeon triangulifer]|uniref:uncharacterized protein LOC132201697 n=1 Tax=Neocloeon triangulifer TaxID=2078957 RepID=UPI00286F3BC9|nr:uncharacterized protein LOC132201697 [Neocloeon triangulifer]
MKMLLFTTALFLSIVSFTQFQSIHGLGPSEEICQKFIHCYSVENDGAFSMEPSGKKFYRENQLNERSDSHLANNGYYGDSFGQQFPESNNNNQGFTTSTDSSLPIIGLTGDSLGDAPQRSNCAPGETDKLPGGCRKKF